MQIRFEFDELTAPGDASKKLVGGCWGNTELNSNEQYLKFIAPTYRELKIALDLMRPYIKKGNN